MRSACLVRTRSILNNFSGIGLGGPRTPPLGYAPATNYFARLDNTLLKDEESARDSRVLACNFAKYLPILKKTDSAVNLS